GGHDGAQLTHRPAVLLVAEIDAVQGQRLSGANDLPGAAAVGAVQGCRAGPADDPPVPADAADGVAVPILGHMGRQAQVGEVPAGAAGAVAEQHQAALTDGDAAAVAQGQAAQGPATEDVTVHLEQPVAAERGLAVPGAGQGALAGSA